MKIPRTSVTKAQTGAKVKSSEFGAFLLWIAGFAVAASQAYFSKRQLERALRG